MIHPKHPFALVLWNDAHSPASGDSYTVTSIAEVHGSLPVLTAGWVLRDDASGISLAAEWYVEEPNFRGLTYIPRAMVVEVQRLAMPRQRKKAAVTPPAGSSSALPPTN